MLRNIIKVLLSNVLLSVVGFLNSFIFTSIMSIEGFAMYHTFILYVTYTYGCHLGVPSGMFVKYGGKEYADTDKAQYRSEMSIIFIALLGFTAVVMAASAIFKSPILFAVSLMVLPVCILATYKSLYQAWSRFTAYSVINAAPVLLLTLLCVVGYLFYGELDGGIIIAIYVAIYIAIAIWLLAEYFMFVRGTKRAPIFSKENFNTLKSGFLLMIGEYVALMFYAIDKQFVEKVYSTYSFAMYSFAMSTTTIMNTFIRAFAAPLYPALAKGDVSEQQMNILKEILFMFGSLSGCAYFVVKFFIDVAITKYTGSLEVISVFFAAFPAIAVINVLYINLYKVTNQLKKYTFSLVVVLAAAFGANVVAVLLDGDKLGIAIATLVVYYFWLFYSKKDFKNIIFSVKDIMYLTVFFIIYGVCVFALPAVIGFVMFTVMILLTDILFYKDSALYMVRLLLEKYIRKGNSTAKEN